MNYSLVHQGGIYKYITLESHQKGLTSVEVVLQNNVVIVTLNLLRRPRS